MPRNELAVLTSASRWTTGGGSSITPNRFGSWNVSLGGYGDAGAHAVLADYDGDGRADLVHAAKAGVQGRAHEPSRVGLLPRRAVDEGGHANGLPGGESRGSRRWSHAGCVAWR
jgi:hypothetical protein